MIPETFRSPVPLTRKDLALAAGVHQTSLSRTLRSGSRITGSARTRIPSRRASGAALTQRIDDRNEGLTLLNDVSAARSRRRVQATLSAISRKP